MKPLNKRIVRKLKESKLQYFAITVVMMVGIILYLSFNIGIYNFENSVNLYYEKNNFADISVEVLKIPKSSIDEVLSVNGVKAVEGRLKIDVPLKRKDGTQTTIRLVTLPDNIKINQLYHINGSNKLPNKNDVFIIEHFNQGTGLSLGDVITPQINGKLYDMEIKGVVGSPEYVYLMKDAQSLVPDFNAFGLAYVREDFLQDAFDYGKSYNELVIDVEEGYNLDVIKNEVEKKLDKYGVMQILTKENQLSNRIVTEEIKGGKKSAETVPLLFIGVSAIILSVMINRLVKSDRMIIGVLKSMGYTNIQVLIHYSKFAILIGFIGSLFGVIFGTLLSKSFTNMYLMFYKVHYVKTDLYLPYLLMAIIIGTLFSVVSGLLGARNALKIAPAESMRKEPPKKGKRVLFENSWLWDKMRFTTKMVWRNIMRSKKRVAFIATGVALTFLVVLMPLFLFDVMMDLFSSQYGEFWAMDYQVTFSKSISTDEIHVIDSKLNDAIIEPYIEYPFEISHLWHSKIINVIGIKEYSEMFNFKNQEGDTIIFRPGDIFVSQGIANLLEIDVGDEIHINNYIPGKDDISVVVTGVVEQGLGSNIYMDYELVSSRLAERNLMTGVYINSDDDVKQKLEKIRNISEVKSNYDLQEIFKEFMQITIASITSMLFMGFILGFAIIYNSTIMTINSRRLEFSSLRVLGMTKKEISRIVSKENFVITIVGIILGIPLSIMSASKISEAFSTDLYNFPSDIPPINIFYAAVATTLFIVIAQGAAYIKINKLDFIEALKERIT